MHPLTASPMPPHIDANTVPVARRTLVTGMASSAIAATPAAGRGSQPPSTAPASGGAAPSPGRGTERIALLIYPGFTALDLFGPHNMLAGLRPARMDLVAATREPVVTDTGI